MSIRGVRRVALALLAGALCAGAVQAQSPLDAKGSLRDNLAALVGFKKPVTVVLQNGQSYRAQVAAVGDAVVVLTAPSQKEFYDVVVPLAQVAAVEVPVRQP
ncbi:MAG: hypothetical protein SF182_08785 [Deltaproteobacteria bacterium]|nr:hypothetical protein [Deltaproteobacteria bacterium]